MNRIIQNRFLLAGLLSCFFNLMKIEAQCSSITPAYTVNLSASPTATYLSPSITRADTCCLGVVAGDCLKFTIFLNPNAQGINFGFASGAQPPGALFYQINCGPPTAVGTPICLSGTGPHVLTFCKPGGNSNTYSVSSIPNPSLPDTISLRSGCTQTLAASGFSPATITWGAINGGTNTGLFNSYLNCLIGCSTIAVTPTGTVPVAFVDYTVGGYGLSPCISNYYKDTVRVFFYNDLIAPLTNTTICFGSTSAVLSPTASGGKPSYTYSWSTGSTNPFITVGIGTYTLYLGDQTGCPPITSTVTVGIFTTSIAANAGPNSVLCKTSPTCFLIGTVSGVSTGSWSGGTGSFLGAPSQLTNTYVPSLLEINSGSLQLFLNTTNNLGCPPGASAVTILFQNAASLTPISNQTVCANNSVLTLSTTITGYTASSSWTSTGTGTFSATNNTLTNYTPSALDISTGSVTIFVSTINNGMCGPATESADIIITPKPFVNAGPNQTICSVSSAVLNATISGGATTGSWTSTGNGSFVPSTTALSASYIPGSSDLAAGSVTLFLSSTNFGNCLLVRDTLVLFIKSQATVNIVSTASLCSNTPTIAITGTVIGTTNTGTWSTNGTGNFISPISNLANTYSLSALDIANGFISFSLSSTNNGPCASATAGSLIPIAPLPFVSAGMSPTICSINGTLALSGTVISNASTGAWSYNGTGIILGPTSNFSPTYSFSPNDITTGSVNFTLSSTNNGVCPIRQSTVTAYIVKQPTVLTTASQTICSTTPTIVLTGTILSTSGLGFWSTPGTGTLINSSNLSTSYSISATDITNGLVMFSLNSVSTAPCASASNTLQILINSISVVTSGTYVPICTNQSNFVLNGSIIGGSGQGQWSTSGTGTLTNSTNLNTTYNFSPADKLLSALAFTLSSLNNGVCPAVKSVATLPIVKIATVTTVANLSACSNTAQAQVTGTIAGGGGSGTWSSNGTGIFSPNASVLTTTYLISSTDQQNSLVIFTLSSTNNGPCPVQTSTLQLLIQQLPVVLAGNDQLICSVQNSVALSGSVLASAGSGSWSSSGSGTFATSNQNLSTIYQLSANDLQSNALTFTLSSTNNGVCPKIDDVLTVQIQKLALVEAGKDFSVCSTLPNFNITGSITSVSNAGVWSSNGSGSLTPASSGLNAVYFISNADITKKTVVFSLLSLSTSVCPSIKDSVTVYIITNPSISVQPDTAVCTAGKAFFLRGSMAGDKVSFSWTSNGTGSFVPNATTLLSTYVPSLADLASLKLTFKLQTNDAVCGNKLASTEITILPVPTASFVMSSSIINIPAETANFTNKSIGARRYKWDFGDGSAENSKANPTHLYKNVGYFNVNLIAINEFGCQDTATQQLTAVTDIKFPSAFTPNPSGSNGGRYTSTDLSNDVFFPFTDGLLEYKLSVFNRWGELIFDSTDLLIGWDGYFQGKLCQQDAYVFKASGKFFDGKTFNQVGTVTLIR
jgi:gliding motility-associated-like protein